MNDESVSRPFAGCHVLQELVLHKYVGDTTTISNISIPTLKIMSIRFATGRHKHKLKISAPILEYLNLQDNMGLEFDLEDVSSLVEANVSVTWLENHHIPLLKALCTAKFVSFHWDRHTKMQSVASASTSRRSSVTCTAVRRLQSSTIAADHPLKLPPKGFVMVVESGGD
ncbi:hypothetical protein V6N13_009810 [Hibiscus sabdariffa]